MNRQKKVFYSARLEYIFNSNELHQVILIEAPAGYGKTTQSYYYYLRLSKSKGCKTIWIDKRQHKDINELLCPFLQKDVNSWIFIDDAHKLDASLVEKLVETVLQSQSGLKLFLIRRPVLQPKFSKLSLNNEIVKIGVQDLSFTRDEIRNYLKCSKQIAKNIYDISEGLPVCISVFKASGVNNRTNQRDLSNVDLEIFWAFVKEEIISQLPKAYLSRLCSLSILDPFDFEDAKNVLDVSSEELAILLRKLDPVWVGTQQKGHINACVRECLNQLAWEEKPQEMKDLHLKAGQYYWEKGNLVIALAHASKSGRTSYICNMIENSGGVYLLINEGLERVKQVMAFTNDQITTRYPRLLLIKALLHIKEGNLAGANRYWKLARDKSEGFLHDREGGDDKALRSESRVVGSLLAGYGCHSLEEQIELAQPMLKEADIDGHNDTQQGFLHTVICIHNLQNGNFANVRKHAALSESAFENAGSNYGRLYLDFHRAGASYAEGRAEEARFFCAKAETLRRKYFPLDSGIKSIGNIFTSELSCEAGSFIGAKRKLSGLHKKIQHGEAWFDVYAAAIQAFAYVKYLELGYLSSVTLLSEIRDVAKAKGLKRVVRFIDTIRMELACRDLKISEAERLSLKLDLEGVINDPDMREHLMWREYKNIVVASAMYLKMQGSVDESRRHLNDLIKYGDRSGNKVCQLYGLANLAVQDEGELVRFGNLVCATGYVLPIALSPKLRRMCESDPQLKLITRRVVDQVSLLSPQKKDGFTLREKEVLRILERGDSDKGIAVELDVSVHAVRFHMKNIFNKTGARDRHSALVLAKGMLAKW